VAAVAGGGWALAASSAGAIHACATKKTGALRVARKCKKSEKTVSWNARGLRGLRGGTGAQGPPGPATGAAGGDLTGSYPNPLIANGVITDPMVAAANKDGAASTPSLRTLGSGAQQAMPGNATPGGPPTGPAGGSLTGSYPNPSIANGSITGAKLNVPISLSAATTPSPFFSLTSGDQGVIGSLSGGADLSASRTDTTGVGPAIYGSTSSIFGNAATAGVVGDAVGSGGIGVYASHSSSSGFGFALQAASNGPGIALEADANGTGSAARFIGGVAVTGNLSVSGSITAGTKDFKIDDPADPANKFLIHTSVESPQAQNVYNGNITTDGNGYATVHLPSYFDAENVNPRYQLTVIGSFARAVVWKEERGNRFVVRTEQPRVKVSWQVTGIRNDPYARSQRGAAEQSKPAGDRGRYLYPQGFGRPASDTISGQAPAGSR
jgi:hypothetical protein